MADIIYIANTNNILLTGLKSEQEGTYLNDATVTLTLKDSTGTEVGAGPWPITMDYVAASSGNYIGYLSADLALLQGKKYTAFIDADASDSNTERKGHWEFPLQAAKRTS